MDNKSLFALKPIDTLVLVKALSVLLLVANHAPLAGLHGGLNGLLLVSGISMATFAFNGTTAQTLHAFMRFTLRLAIPSVILAFIICTLKGRRSAFRSVEEFRQDRVRTAQITSSSP